MSTVKQVVESKLTQVFAGQDAWFVGGAVRDELLGRDYYDFDIATTGEIGPVAKQLAHELKASVFQLSDQFGTWRVSDREGAWQVDISETRGDSIESDLMLRDFTVNAIARAVGGDELIDVTGGIEDLHGRKLREVSPRSFKDDPLRVVRLVRASVELGFEYETSTAELACASAGKLSTVANERVFAELTRILSVVQPSDGVKRLDQVGALEVVIPEVSALQGMGQSKYHHLDVYEHTLLVLDNVAELEKDSSFFGQPLEGLMSAQLGDDMTRWQALRFAALLHDIGKPPTRKLENDGHVTFHRHDEVGYVLSADVIRRLRGSRKLVRYVSELTLHHLKPGFLVHEEQISSGITYDFLRATDPVSVDLLLLSAADRLATGGENFERDCERHMSVIEELMPAAIAWVSRDKTPLVRGDVLARELGINPDDRLGTYLAKIDRARYCDEISNEQEAVALARKIAEGER